MKRALRTLFILALAVGLSACSGSRQSAPEGGNTAAPTPAEDSRDRALLAFQEVISPDFLRPRLAAFAHDSMEGRETGTRGLRMAAGYLAAEYRAMGFQPVGDDSSYFQHFKLNATRSDSVVYVVSDTSDSRVVDRSVASARSRARFLPGFGNAGGGRREGEIVFAGFGVNDFAREVRHLEGAGLEGKWVMVYQEIPAVVEGDTLVDPSLNSRSRFNAILSESGARGIVVIPDMSPSEFENEAGEERADFGEPQGMSLAYRGGGSGGNNGTGYSVIHPELASRLLGLEGGASALREHRRELLDGITEFRARDTGYALSRTGYATEVTVETRNVVAYLEGDDPEVNDEVVVLTSHYDHLGIGQPDRNGDRIYNGADDDGSGTIGLLNVAKAFADARDQGVRPRRSILFLNVSGEEKGLLGSRYYSDHPIFPMEKTVTNLNVDMIGRVDRQHEEQGISEYAYIIGGRIISSDLDSLLEAANARAGRVELDPRYNDLKDPNQFYRRSDHWNFGRLGVPFAFFFTGVHEDYHQQSDEAHKILYEKMSKITRTIYATAVMVANTDDPPEVDNQEFIEATKVSPR